jgi:signal peptide peptidase SppA
MHALPHLAARLLDTPLLIHPHKLDVILAILGMRIGVTPLAAPAMPTSMPQPSAAAYQADRIAVIPVTGSLVNRTLGLDTLSGLTSYSDVRQSLDAALADPKVEGIVLDIDSPGGEAGGAFDLADRIFAARRVKPVWAVANDQAFSAAYAIASSCERVLVTRTGGVGSIGVIAMHIDQSQKDAQEGYRYTPIHAGQRKVDFNPHAPLSPDAQTALQTEVNRLHTLFVATVSRNRGIPDDTVRATEAGLFFGDTAVTAQLADAVGTLDDAVAQMTHVIQGSRTALTSRTVSPSGSHSAAGASLSTTQQENPPMESSHPTAPESGAATPSSASPSVDAAVAHATQQALAIADLCLLAGMPERTADLLTRRVTVEDARRELLTAKAAAHSEEIHSRLNPSATSPVTPALDQNPVVKAAQARARRA